jgi:protein gp37
MAKETGISWTDSTFNPWWGCSKVGPGCDNCYAESLDHRTGGDHWGTDKTPRIMSASNWQKPLNWNRRQEAAKFAWLNDDRKRRVFCGSMCDVFDNNAPEGQRERLWPLIHQTSNLNWQLLTKRAPNISRLLPSNWGNGFDNAWIGVTVENRKHGLPRIDVLREIPAVVRFLSIEPLLEDLGRIDLSGIHWVIVGLESGPNARVISPEPVLNIKHQCDEQGVPFFFKQWGGHRRDKGGCLIDGREYKQFPNTENSNFL